LKSFLIVRSVDRAVSNIPPRYQRPCVGCSTGGHVVVFEHNPLNPVTRFVVARTPIDPNAILLRAAEVMRGLSGAGFVAPVASS